MKECSEQNVAPFIYIYENKVRDIESISSILNTKNNWSLRNFNADSWSEGERIYGYEELPITFNFDINQELFNMGKDLNNIIKKYCSQNNVKTEIGMNYCTVRKYYKDLSFLKSEDPYEISKSKITCFLFLEDINDGGNVEFKEFNTSIASKKGQVLVFPSSFAYRFKINRPKDKENIIVITSFL